LILRPGGLRWGFTLLHPIGTWDPPLVSYTRLQPARKISWVKDQLTSGPVLLYFVH